MLLGETFGTLMKSSVAVLLNSENCFAAFCPALSLKVSGGKPVVHAPAPHKRLEDFHILEFICGYGEHIAIHDNEVGEFSGFEGSLEVLFKAGVGSVPCVECERLFYRDAFLGG
jgi:hypothetical protein